MKTIKLRLYRGKELLYNSSGKVTNENQTIKLSDGNEWLNFLKYIKAQGFCQVDLISVTEKGKEVSDTSLHLSQLTEACEPAIKVVEISEKQTKKEPVDDKNSIREALKKEADELGISYAKNISVEKLQEKIDAEKSK